MKLLTLNTHSWVEADQIAKLYEIANVIEAEAFDVIALQEVNQYHKSPLAVETNLESLCEIPIKEDNFGHLLLEILKRKGLAYHGIWASCHTGFEIYEEGIALLALAPFEDKQKIVFRSELEFEDVRRRTVVGASLEINGQRQWFYSAHFSWWEFKGENLFEEEWQSFESNLASPTEPIFIMGDFNNDATVKAEGYQFVQAQRQWQDSFHAAKEKNGEHTVTKSIVGWDENEKKLRIDYILSSHEVGITSYQVVFDGNRYPVVSDHFGIIVEVEEIEEMEAANAS